MKIDEKYVYVDLGSVIGIILRKDFLKVVEGDDIFV